MTDKKLKVNSAAYTELSIQIAVLQASVDKLLQLAMKPEITIKPLKDSVDALFKDLESTTDYDQTKPYGFTHENIK